MECYIEVSHQQSDAWTGLGQQNCNNDGHFMFLPHKIILRTFILNLLAKIINFLQKLTINGKTEFFNYIF